MGNLEKFLPRQNHCQPRRLSGFFGVQKFSMLPSTTYTIYFITQNGVHLFEQSTGIQLNFFLTRFWEYRQK